MALTPPNRGGTVLGVNLDLLNYHLRAKGLDIPLAGGIIVAVLLGDLSLAVACIMSYVLVRCSE